LINIFSSHTSKIKQKLGNFEFFSFPPQADPPLAENFKLPFISHSSKKTNNYRPVDFLTERQREKTTYRVSSGFD